MKSLAFRHGVGAMPNNFANQQTVIVQPKLMVNAPNDAYEQEADAVADRVMRKPLVSSKAQGTQGMLASSVQRKCAHCEEDKKQKPVMRKAEGRGGFETSPAFASQLSNTRGGGQAMPSETRGFMESRFGRNFSQVRIHTGGSAANMNQDIQAKAFTHGSDIYFNQGEFSPNTEGGKRLLAHELVHTVQQKNKAIYRKITATTEGDIPETDKELSVDNPQIVADFKAVNIGLGRGNLKKWIEMSIQNGWTIGYPIPDYREPTVVDEKDGEPVIEAVDFNGKNGAFARAAIELNNEIGKNFYWKHRFTEEIGHYVLSYSGNQGYQNYLLHNKDKDVDFDDLLNFSEDKTDYNEIMKIKAYSDKLLSGALVRLVKKIQIKLYPDNTKKQTGVLDVQTIADMNSKVTADKEAAQKQAEEQNKKDLDAEEQNKKDLDAGVDGGDANLSSSFVACFDGKTIYANKNGKRDNCTAITGSIGAPTPDGEYLIREQGVAIVAGGLKGRLLQNRELWYLLEPQFSTTRFKMILHPGTLSSGCVTVTDKNCFSKIAEILNSSGTIEGKGYDGYPPGNTEGVKTEEKVITSVGKLIVKNGGKCDL